MSDLAVLLICVVPSVCMLLLGAYIRWSTYYTRNYLHYHALDFVENMMSRFIVRTARFRKKILDRRQLLQWDLEKDNHVDFPY